MKDKITLLDKSFVPYISYEELSRDIDAVAAKINDYYKDASDIPVILCVLNGSILFTSELMKRFEFDCELVAMKLSSYEGTRSTGSVREVMGMTTEIRGRRVLVVEDIVDTGTTIVALEDALKKKGASDVKICTMLLKPEVYKKDVKLDFIAREIENRFIVGFGLDYNNIGRNYKDIYILES